MLTTKNDIAARLKAIAVKKYQKIMTDIQEKRIEKERTRLQAALMSGCIRRIKSYGSNCMQGGRPLNSSSGLYLFEGPAAEPAGLSVVSPDFTPVLF